MSKSIVAVVLAALIAASCGGCGDADEPKPTAAGNATDARFVNGMIPHHEGAIGMAELAIVKTKREEIRRLATDIIESQRAEIAQMIALQSLLPQSAGTMMSADAVAMMDREIEALSIAPDFDREFIVDMIPHHESAITMSRRLQLDGQSEKLRSLSRAIIAAQTAEIAQLRRWYEAWFDEPAPSSDDGRRRMR